MERALESMIRDAYAGFGRGDLDGYLSACTPDFVFHVRGRSAVAGSFRGKEGLYKLAGIVTEVSGGGFQEEVEDVLANNVHAVVLARHQFTRDRKPSE